jgi:hypothetical protein
MCLKAKNYHKYYQIGLHHVLPGPSGKGNFAKCIRIGPRRAFTASRKIYSNTVSSRHITG